MSQSPPPFSAFAAFSQAPTFLIESWVPYSAEAVASIYSEHPFFFPLALCISQPPDLQSAVLSPGLGTLATGEAVEGTARRA